MVAYFNPLDERCKSVIGAVEQNNLLKIALLTDSVHCKFVIRKDGTNQFNSYPMQREGEFFTFSFRTDEVGLFWYHFDFCDGNFLGIGKNYEGEIQNYPNPFQLTVFKKGYAVPEWLNGGIIYQIFPDRFNKVGDLPLKEGKKLHINKTDIPDYKPNEEGEILNNDFYGGNLKGIIEKLDYIKGLGTTAIYLNPIFEAYSNHRYDTGDYMKIDELLGSEEDLKELIFEADKKGIKIILDGVFNHTGSDSIYFNKNGTYSSIGAYQSKKSKYYNWYNFKEYPNDYDSWWGVKTLPAVNENSKSYSQFITGKKGVVEHYASLGIGGFRLDVADELPDSFIKKIRKTLKKVDKNAFLIGEVWEDATNKISYGKRRAYFQGEELDSAMNYTLKDAIIKFIKSKDARSLALTIKEQIDHYPSFALNVQMNILGTHDTKRILTALSDAPETLEKDEKACFKLSKNELEKAIFALKIATVLQYTLYGVPSIYYGDEAGMEGFDDPFNRLFYPWNNENKEVLSWYKKLAKLREREVFANGKYKELYLDRNFLCYERRSEEDLVVVAINLGDSEYYLNFDKNMQNLATDEVVVGKITVSPRSFAVFYPYFDKIIDKEKA